jgi:ribonuclease HII
MYSYEKKLIDQGFNLIAGVDEVGRGSLAGPIAAAAVIIDAGKVHLLKEVKDSKLLTEGKRERLFELITGSAICFNTALLSHEFIDDKGLTSANKTVIKNAVSGLDVKPDYILCDAFDVDFNLPALGLIKGDRISLSIAAASIIAKVTRDRLMVKIHSRYPQYKFHENKGYSSDAHWKALREHGPSPVHRLSFNGVAQPALFTK